MAAHGHYQRTFPRCFWIAVYSRLFREDINILLVPLSRYCFDDLLICVVTTIDTVKFLQPQDREVFSGGFFPRYTLLLLLGLILLPIRVFSSTHTYLAKVEYPNHSIPLHSLTRPRKILLSSTMHPPTLTLLFLLSTAVSAADICCFITVAKTTIKSQTDFNAQASNLWYVQCTSTTSSPSIHLIPSTPSPPPRPRPIPNAQHLTRPPPPASKQSAPKPRNIFRTAEKQASGRACASTRNGTSSRGRMGS